MGLQMAERKAVTKQMAGRYAKASKKDKGKMLDELCALTGWTRRHARRALAQAIASQRPPRPPRPRIYGPEVLEPLRVIWATLNGPAGKRLAPFMPQIVEALERCGEIRIEPRRRGTAPERSRPKPWTTLDRPGSPSSPRRTSVRRRRASS